MADQSLWDSTYKRDKIKLADDITDIAVVTAATETGEIVSDLQITHWIGKGTRSEACARLAPDQMRAVAAALLTAADRVEGELTPLAAAAKEKAEALNADFAVCASAAAVCTPTEEATA